MMNPFLNTASRPIDSSRWHSHHSFESPGLEVIQVLEGSIPIATLRVQAQHHAVHITPENADTHDLFLLDCYARAILAESQMTQDLPIKKLNIHVQP